MGKRPILDHCYRHATALAVRFYSICFFEFLSIEDGSIKNDPPRPRKNFNPLSLTAPRGAQSFVQCHNSHHYNNMLIQYHYFNDGIDKYETSFRNLHTVTCLKQYLENLNCAALLL